MPGRSASAEFGRTQRSPRGRPLVYAGVMLGAVLLASLPTHASGAPSASQSVATTQDVWSFTGSVVTPDRYGGPVSVEGDVHIPAGFECLGSRSSQFFINYSCALALVPEAADGSIPTLIPGPDHNQPSHVRAVALAPGNSTGSTTVFVSGSLSSIPAGTRFRWVVADVSWRIGCGGGTCPYETRITPYLIDFAPPVYIPVQTSNAYSTRANSSNVLVGESVTLRMVRSVTWSDGVVTEEPVTGSLTLQFRATGSGSWVQVGSGNNVVVSPTQPGDFRFLRDGQVTDPVFVNVVRPSSAVRFSQVAVSPASAVANSVVEISASAETQYDDLVWRPSPADTAVELQFLAEGGSAWSRVASSKATDVGRVLFRWPMLGSGRFRLVSGSAVSETVAVSEIRPTSVVAPDPLDLPTEVFPGEPLDISLGVDVQYSDGQYRDAPDGTAFAVEFAESLSGAMAGPRALSWQVAARGVTAQGRAGIQVQPRTSGYWRVAFGEVRTSSVFVEVVGSQPAPPQPVTLTLAGAPTTTSVAWSFSPVPGVTYAAIARTRAGAVPVNRVTVQQAGRVSVTGLAPGTTVTVLVTGTDAYNQSDGGTTASATTAQAPGTAPGTVVDLMASAPRRGKVTVTWKAPAGPVSGYQYRTSNGRWSAWKVAKKTRVTINVNGANPPTVIQVRAVNATGPGPAQQTLI